MKLKHRPFKDLLEDSIKNREPSKAGLTVRAEGSKAVLRIYDVIGWPFIEAQDVAEALDGLDVDEIEVQINSPGGDAFEGVAIYNALRTHPAKITTRVDGLAASAASVIAQAGDHRVMLTGSQMMIHDAWGLAIGNAEVMGETAGVLDKISDSIAGIYAERAGSEGWRDAMLAESWYTHDEAVEAGLADAAVKPSRKTQASLDDTPVKFSDQLAAAVAAVEQVAAEAENVMTFRSEQGKTPLSDEAVALVDKARGVLEGLAEPDPKPVTNTVTDADRLRAYYSERANDYAAQTSEVIGVLSHGDTQHSD